MNRAWTFLCAGSMIAGASACGGGDAASPTPTTRTANVAIAKPIDADAHAHATSGEGSTGASTTPAFRGGRGTPRLASDTMRSHWPADYRSSLAIYADVVGLLGTDMFRGAAPTLLNAFDADMNAAGRACVAKAGANVREAMISPVSESGDLWLVRFDAASAKSTVDACIAAAGFAATTIDGADEAWNDSEPNRVFALKNDLLVVGQPDTVKAALRGGSTSWPSDLHLVPDQYVIGTYETHGMKGDAWVSTSPTTMRIAFETRIPPDSDFGPFLEKQVTDLKKAANVLAAPMDPATQEVVKRLAHALVVHHEGDLYTEELALDEPPADQARDLGTGATLAIGAMRTYLLHAKEAEARGVVDAIARATVSAWEENGGTANKKARFHSYPAVPKTVPRGTKYSSSSGDWTKWSPIHFSSAYPQYYQYEVVAAKDGMSEDIVARGDLNGDGKTSAYTIHMEIDPKTHALEDFSETKVTNGDE